MGSPYRPILVESNQKKATFLREVVRTLALTNVEVFAGRSETLPSTVSAADIVTLRALERFDSALPSAAQLVKPGGRLAILVGESQSARVSTLVKDFDWGQPVTLPLSLNRVLIIGRKESS